MGETIERVYNWVAVKSLIGLCILQLSEMESYFDRLRPLKSWGCARPLAPSMRKAKVPESSPRCCAACWPTEQAFSSKWPRTEVRFAMDSPLEGSGFELVVPL
jgi:hypothetical protein